MRNKREGTKSRGFNCMFDKYWYKNLNEYVLRHRCNQNNLNHTAAGSTKLDLNWMIDPEMTRAVTWAFGLIMMQDYTVTLPHIYTTHAIYLIIHSYSVLVN